MSDQLRPLYASDLLRLFRVLGSGSYLVLANPALAQEKALMSQVTMSDQDAGRTVSLHVGDTIALSLPENATTGYRWSIERLASSVLEAHESEPIAVSGAVGSGGVARWVFTAKAPGTTQVMLKLWRPWEGESSILQRFAFGSIVTP